MVFNYYDAGRWRREALTNVVYANAEAQTLPGPIGSVNRHSERNSQRQASPITEGQTKGTRLPYEIASDSRLLDGERLGFLDRADSEP